MNEECPFCGQGLLLLVEIIPQALGRYVICSECERMWREGDPIEPKFALDYVAFMESRGLEATWTNLKQLSDRPIAKRVRK